MTSRNTTILTTFLFTAQLFTNQSENIVKYQKLLVSDPMNLAILIQLANEFYNNKQYDEAIINYNKILRKNPKNTKILFNLGLCNIVHTKDLETAKKYFTKIISIDPHNAKAYAKRAGIFVTEKKIDNAIEDYKKAIAIDPTFFEAYKQLATLLQNKKEYEEAVECLEKALELNPKNITMKFNLGHLCTMLGKSQKAIEQYEKLLQINPKNYQVLHNVGYNLKVEDRVDEAIQMYEQALQINPEYEASIYAQALAYLYKGDFKTGWKKYSWRLKKEKRNAEKLRKFLENNKLNGKKIFLIPEGGLGDTIQFIRYAESLKNRGAHVIVSVQKPLIPLLSNCKYIDKLTTPKNRAGIRYDDFGSIMSMPAIFESTEETMPKNIPYIFPDKTLVKKWGEYFQDNNNFKIGICWQADLKNDVSRYPVAHRSIPIEKLGPLTKLKNVTFYCLQKEEHASDLKHLPDNFVVHMFGPDFDNTAGAFMDTAAIMKHLDLVITVDTAVAHLAGAIGTPVFVMLPYNTDWRWISKRKDSPWYPSMMVFKQSKPFDWDGVVQEIYEELKQKL